MKTGVRDRRAVSELLATLIMIAVTLIAGTAAFGWILLQAGNSEQSYGNSVAGNVNFLNERFAIVSQAFSGAGGPPPPACALPSPAQCRLASFWVYNTGSVDFTLFTIQVKNLTKPPDNAFLNLAFTHSGFTRYNRLGGNITAGCTNIDAANGFPLAVNGFIPNTLVPIGKLSGNPFEISMPNCAGQLYLFDGTTYTVTLTGLYGNFVTESITPNG